MYLRYQETDLSFKIDGDKIIATKIINRKIHKIEKVINTNTIDYLWKVLDNLSNLPEEFWKISEGT